jgi:hypothetical protein
MLIVLVSPEKDMTWDMVSRRMQFNCHGPKAGAGNRHAQSGVTIADRSKNQPLASFFAASIAK